VDGRQEFEANLARLDSGDAEGLLRCALLLSQDENPNINVEACVKRIDDIARMVTVGSHAGPAEQAEAINTVLFQTLGFHGTEENYYHARNNFLDYVLEVREGIPISMCLLYVEVGRRAGVRLAGIGLPGHVVVQVGSGELFVDPFHRGVLLNRQGVERLTGNFLSEGERFMAEWLEPLTPRSFLARLLRNLKAAYAQGFDMPRLAWVCDRLVRVLPDDLVERRDRGLVLFSQKRYGLAAADLEYYLHRLTDEEERVPLEELYRKARQFQALMN
jgi:regulator of sirC expression with transglutaminase-like and TPR domain